PEGLAHRALLGRPPGRLGQRQRGLAEAAVLEQLHAAPVERVERVVGHAPKFREPVASDGLGREAGSATNFCVPRPPPGCEARKFAATEYCSPDPTTAEPPHGRGFPRRPRPWAPWRPR